MTPMPSAMQKLCAVQPQLVRVVTAAEALGLGARELLHAGPPLSNAYEPPAVLMSSAVMTCLHERWASDADSAEAMVRAGALRWAPAQGRGVVTPLAGVVSAGTPLFEVDDAAGSGLRAWAPVSTVGGPDTRMGSRDAGVLQRLALRDLGIAPAWRDELRARGPLALYPLARDGLAHGDDLHGRTAAANASLVEWIDSPQLAAQVAAMPLFFLTLWMAACSLALRAAEGGDAPSLVTRAGGNGEHFGIALAAAPDVWFQLPASPPLGHLAQGVPAGTAVCGAIGDSAVIDALGFGGQRLYSAPEPQQVHGDFLPEGHAGLAERLLRWPHPGFPAQRVGLDAAAVVRENAAPLVVLAMLAEDGRRGFVGRGIYRPPVALFGRALAGAAPAAAR